MRRIDSATPNDIPQLCALLAILFAQEADFQPDEVKQSAALRTILSKPETGCILVMREGEKILGMVNLLYTISTACGGRVALLEDMVVHPDYRQDGMGSQLLNGAKTWAQRTGCLRLTLLTDRANEPAIRFYQRHSFKLSAMIPLRLSLDTAVSTSPESD